jgi:7-cyano-7-deazaguanine synthase
MRPLVLSSGGLDSAVIAAMYRDTAVHLWIDYGQRNVYQEARASRAIASYYGAEHVRASVDVSAMQNSSVTGEVNDDLFGAATVVPNRNAILLSMGVATALAHRCDAVFIGCNAADYADYPDCRPAFIYAATQLAQLATNDQVTVEAPLLGRDKAAIGRMALELSVPVTLTYSCYRGEVEPCGRCNACAGREEAFGVHHR